MITQALKRFLAHESAGGIVLALAAAAALAASNSAWAPSYEAFRQLPGEIRLGTGDVGLVLAKPLVVWVNDLWMAVFFFLVGLEIKFFMFRQNSSHVYTDVANNATFPGGSFPPSFMQLSWASWRDYDGDGQIEIQMPDHWTGEWVCERMIRAFETLRIVGGRIGPKEYGTCWAEYALDYKEVRLRPRAGFGEINLPPRQAGSSIMPGKVNPVIPEVVNQIAFEVIGNDMTVTFAAEAGQLQLNAFEPIIAHSLFKSVLHLRKGCKALADYCIDDITANRESLRASVERSIGIVTALNPYIGYANATEIAAEAHLSGRGVAEIVLERKLMSPAQLADVLRPEVLTKPQMIPTHAV